MRLLLLSLLLLWPGTYANPPQRIKWKKQEWKIVLVNWVTGEAPDPMFHPLLKDQACGNGINNDVYAGYTYRKKHRIELCQNLIPAELARTFYHELEHVVVGGDIHDGVVFENRKMTGHEAITSLEGMSDLLGQNPEVGEYFKQVAKGGK